MSNKDRKKKRETKRKELRLAREKTLNELNRKLETRRAHVNLIMVRGTAELVIGLQRGLFGSANGPLLRLAHDEIVGASEDLKELGGILTKLGLLTMSHLIGHNLAYGTDGLANNLAKWAGIDLEALKAEAEKEVNDFDSNRGPGDVGTGGGQGDCTLRSDSEQQAQETNDCPVGRDEPGVEIGEAR